MYECIVMHIDLNSYIQTHTNSCTHTHTHWHRDTYTPNSVCLCCARAYVCTQCTLEHLHTCICCVCLYVCNNMQSHQAHACTPKEIDTNHKPVYHIHTNTYTHRYTDTCIRLLEYILIYVSPKNCTQHT